MAGRAANQARREPALGGRPLRVVLAAVGLAAALCAVASADFRQADRQRALEIGLRLADVGPGWIESTGGKSPRTMDTGAVAGQSVTAECGDPATAKTETNLIVTAGSMSSFTTAARSPSLVSLVMLFKTSFLARKEAEAAHDLAKLKPCLVSELRKALGGLKAGATTVRPLRFSAPSLAGAYRIVTRLVGGATPRIYLDLLVTQHGRGVVETIVLAIDSVPSTAVEHRVVAVSAGRLAKDA